MLWLHFLSTVNVYTDIKGPNRWRAKPLGQLREKTVENRRKFLEQYLQVRIEQVLCAQAHLEAMSNWTMVFELMPQIGQCLCELVDSVQDGWCGRQLRAEGILGLRGWHSNSVRQESTGNASLRQGTILRTTKVEELYQCFWCHGICTLLFLWQICFQKRYSSSSTLVILVCSSADDSENIFWHDKQNCYDAGCCMWRWASVTCWTEGKSDGERRQRCSIWHWTPGWRWQRCVWHWLRSVVSRGTGVWTPETLRNAPFAMLAVWSQVSLQTEERCPGWHSQL